IGHGVIFCSEAPYDVVAEFGTIDRQFTLGIDAIATSASLLAATIPIGNQVALSVARIMATGNPRARGQFRAGRAIGQRPAAAITQITVDGTMTPVITCLAVFVLRLPAFALQRTDRFSMGIIQPAPAVNRQQR